MALEIERKFLLKDAPAEFIKKAKVILLISQFYFQNPKTKIFERIRIEKYITKSKYKTRYLHTIKKKLSVGVNDETENVISREKAIEFIKPHKDNISWVQKKRHIDRKSTRL